MVDALGVIDATVGAGSTKAGRLEAVICTIDSAETEWRDLQTRAPFGPAQGFDWVRCWRDHVNRDCIAVIFREVGRPVLTLPLEVTRAGPARLARFPGGSHANANFPVCGSSLPKREIQRLLVDALARERPEIDLVRLDRQVGEMEGVDNPLVLPASALHADPVLAAPLDEGFDAVLAHDNPKRRRKKHRQNGRRYEEAGGWRLVRPADRAGAVALLDRFFEMKAARFAAAGIRDVFAETGVKSFLRALHGDAAERGGGDFFVEGLEVAGRIIAVNGLSATRHAMTVDFSAFSEEDALGTSPGEFMFYEEIAAACERGLALFSFGVGDEPYKREWCSLEIALHDTMIALSAKGAATAALLGAAGAAKRAIKRNPRLWSAAKTARGLVNRSIAKG